MVMSLTNVSFWLGYGHHMEIWAGRYKDNSGSRWAGMLGGLSLLRKTSYWDELETVNGIPRVLWAMGIKSHHRLLSDLKFKAADTCMYRDVIDNEAGRMSMGIVHVFHNEVPGREAMMADEVQGIRDCCGERKEALVMKMDEVKTALRRGRFAPLDALLMVHFFVCKGIISPDHPQYTDINRCLHAQLPFPTE
ncbi:hypothetical protein B0H63DRAFT_443538 [Podospora didyma]|uniref:Uncharacterized protein n=1 Tax=Podospora didyma TaxID=330526 RepID=A0AAE0P5D3_9PEZI|nr:hypothetical protein B0H63DRAFT_443538 [Podospora didyma]